MLHRVTFAAHKLAHPCVRNRTSKRLFTNGCETCLSSHSDKALNDIRQTLSLSLDFITEEEEKALVSTITPYFRRLRYQKDHWDSAIVGYRETEIAHTSWPENCRPVIHRILESSGLISKGTALPHSHVLDLEADGHIKPHVDSVRFCGDLIAGVSLLTDAIMRFIHTTDASRSCDVLLKRRSLYVMSGSCRYDYTHEILPSGSLFKDLPIEKGRRLVVICRSKPSHEKLT